LVPEAVESISYGLPTYKYRGKPLVYFGAAKKHLAIYATSEGTIRYPVNERFPRERLKALLDEKVASIKAKPGRKKVEGAT
jgi:uncharacterized protein YdhG (YjbR/CyaY superfamily)